MKLLRLWPLWIAGALACGQDNADLFDKAPPPIDEALRARVGQFFHAYTTGKFREAYPLVAEDGQDAFLASSKNTFKSCEIVKISYSDNFTKAVVVESCKTDWNFHGQTVGTSFPITGNWKIIDGQWYWYYIQPTTTASPFSPLGFSTGPTGPPRVEGAASPLPPIPSDPLEAARNILSKIKLDKTTIKLRGYETSKDELQVINEMPGQISFSFDPLPFPGLKITPGKTQLQANERTTVVFEYRLDDAAIECGECAKRVKSTLTAQLHIQPTGQIFPIAIIFGIPPELEKQIPKQ
jgi:hypothetical protein